MAVAIVTLLYIEWSAVVDTDVFEIRLTAPLVDRSSRNLPEVGSLDTNGRTSSPCAKFGLASIGQNQSLSPGPEMDWMFIFNDESSHR